MKTAYLVLIASLISFASCKKADLSPNRLGVLTETFEVTVENNNKSLTIEKWYNASTNRITFVARSNYFFNKKMELIYEEVVYGSDPDNGDRVNISIKEKIRKDDEIYSFIAPSGKNFEHYRIVGIYFKG